MPRVAAIRQRGQGGWWYTTPNGEKVKPDKDKKEAGKAFHLLESQDVEVERRATGRASAGSGSARLFSAPRATRSSHSRRRGSLVQAAQ